MELVIKIPDEQYNVIKGDLYNTFPSDMRKWGLEAIKNGTPLPKGHGRLIDVERLYDDFESMDYDFEDAIEYAPTIIEADKAERNDKE